jgi:hypothetical protein
VRRRRGRSTGRSRGGTLVVALLALALAPVLAAGQSSEHDVKAAFLYHFAQYVEWPETAFETSSSPFILGVVVGGDEFLPAISSAVADKSVVGRRIVVRVVRAPAEARDCHMVFVTSSQASRLPAVLAELGALPVLTVSDMPGFASAGGAIGFVLEDGKVGFQINPGAARRAGLRISSKLLRLAEIVDAD